MANQRIFDAGKAIFALRSDMKCEERKKSLTYNATMYDYKNLKLFYSVSFLCDKYRAKSCLVMKVYGIAPSHDDRLFLDVLHHHQSIRTLVCMYLHQLLKQDSDACH